MTERLSTGLRDFLLGEGSMRKALEDFVMKIYSGAAPAEADDAITGVLLATITKSSGTVSVGERSTPNAWKLVLDGDHALNDTCIVHIHIQGDAGTSYTYTNNPDLDADGVRDAVTQMLNDIPEVCAVRADDADNEIYVASRVAGIELVITDGAGVITIVPTESEPEVRQDTLWFAKPASGAMAKSTDTWSGLVGVSGVAGYFRLVTSSDDGTDSSTQVRLQGDVSTSGAELNLSSTSLVAGTTLTIDTFSISLPAE